MTRSVDNVYFRITPAHSSILRQDRDPFFPLKIHRVHDSIGQFLMRTHRARLLEHGINQGSLTVIYVCDDRDIASIISKNFSHGL